MLMLKNKKCFLYTVLLIMMLAGCSPGKQEKDEVQKEVEQLEITETKVNDNAEIEEFPIVYQMPELPTGCEITAMTMVLNYYGLPADKVEMATVYLPTLDSTGTYYGDDGLLYGNDLGSYFIGDPTQDSGIACGAKAIIVAANSYLADCGSALEAVNCTGSTADELYEMVSQGIPVVVWCTIGMYDRVVEEGWYTENGDYVDWGTYDHGAVLIGYDDDTVTIADPLAGEVEYSREQFEWVYEERGCQSVILVEAK